MRLAEPRRRRGIRSLALRAKRRGRPAAAWAIRRIPGRRPKWGTLRRLEPFSVHYGYRRGKPIDRRYIDRFLARHERLVRGRVMEVGAADYTERLGHGDVTASEVVDIDASNPAATLVADLGVAGSLVRAHYDCIILVHTLQYVEQPAVALRHLWESLRPGGTLLVTVPCVSRLDPLKPDADLWRWTPAGLARHLHEACVGAQLEVVGYGNVLTSVAFLFGLAQEELDATELDANDAAFPVVACARATKPPT